jgi:hypothetical protein
MAGDNVSPEIRFDGLVTAFVGKAGVTGGDGAGRGARFGAGALKVNGSIFAMLTRGQLVVKLPAARVVALIDDGTGQPFYAGKGTPMKEWLAVASSDDFTWLALAEEALDFVGVGSHAG